MGETVDVLVVGALIIMIFVSPSLTFIAAGNYGSGRRSGGVSTLICAVLDDRRVQNDDDEPK